MYPNLSDLSIDHLCCDHATALVVVPHVAGLEQHDSKAEMPVLSALAVACPVCGHHTHDTC